MEKEKAETLVTAALSNNETNVLSHQELKLKLKNLKPVTTHTDAVRHRVCGEITKVEMSDQVGREVVVSLYAEDSKDDPTVKPPPTKMQTLL